MQLRYLKLKNLSKQLRNKMSYLSAIIQLLVAIPKILDLIKGLFDMIKEQQENEKKREQIKSIDDLKKAKTIQEIKNANKEITKNLP